MKKYLLFLLIPLCLNCSNNSDDELNELPDATQTGEHIFACRVNGEVLFSDRLTEILAIYQNGFIQIGAKGVSFLVSDPIEVGVAYDIVGNSRYFEDLNPNLGCQYGFEDTYQGSVTFTNIDLQNFIA